MQRPVLKLLVDEDVDVDVVPLLRSRGHLVTEVRSAFGDRSDDRENMVLARAEGAILVTCDSRYYLSKRRDSKRSAVPNEADMPTGDTLAADLALAAAVRYFAEPRMVEAWLSAYAALEARDE